MALKGKQATAAELSALDRGRAKGHATRRKRGEQRRAKAKELGKTRRQMFMDGEIDLRDLSIDELASGKIANHDGSFEGRQPMLPPRMLAQLEGERVRRIKAIVKKAGPAIAEEIVDLALNAESEQVRLNAGKHILEHNIGKVPEVVHVGNETAWDKLQQIGFVIARDEDEDIWDAEVVGEE